MIIIGIDPGLQTLGYGILEVFPQKKKKLKSLTLDVSSLTLFYLLANDSKKYIKSFLH